MHMHAAVRTSNRITSLRNVRVTVQASRHSSLFQCLIQRERGTVISGTSRHFCHFHRTMKRKDAPTTKASSPAKKAKPEVPEYHSTPSVKEEDGSIQWPAPRAQMDRAREIIMEWQVTPQIPQRYITDSLVVQKRTRRPSSFRTKMQMVSQQGQHYDIL